MIRQRPLTVAAMVLLLSVACAELVPTPRVTPTRTPIPPSPEPTLTATATLIPTANPQPFLLTVTPQTSSAPSTEKKAISQVNAASVGVVNQVFLEEPAYHIAWSSDSQTLGVQGNESVFFIDPLASKLIKAQIDAGPSETMLDFSPDQQSALIGKDQKILTVRPANSKQPEYSVVPETSYTNAALSPDGKRLAVTTAEELIADVWDLERNLILRRYGGFTTAAPVYSISFSPNGKALIWLARGRVQVQDLETKKLSPFFDHQDYVNSAVLTMDGKILATSSAELVNNEMSPVIKIWNVWSGKLLATIKQPDSITCLAFSSNGRLLVAGESKKLALISVRNYQQLVTLNTEVESITALAFSPDNRTIASASSTGLIQFWGVRP